MPISHSKFKIYALGKPVNLTLNRRLETASTQTKPACAGYKKLDFHEPHGGGLPSGYSFGELVRVAASGVYVCVAANSIRLTLNRRLETIVLFCLQDLINLVLLPVKERWE
jgi:hypothetical protein